MQVPLKIESLYNLEPMSGLKNIETEQEFYEVLRLPKAIIYFLVDWSGPERVSRSIIYKMFNTLNFKEISIFKIDCSAQNQKYIENWLINQTMLLDNFYFGGNGETLLVNNGKVIDFIKCPRVFGLEKTQIIIENWLT